MGLLLSELYHLNGQVPNLDEEQRDEVESCTGGSVVEKDEKEPQKKEACLQSEVPFGVIPSLLDEELDQLLLVNGEIFGVVEVLEELQSVWVVTGRKAQHASPYLNEVLFIALLGYSCFELSEPFLTWVLVGHFSNGSLHSDCLHFFKGQFIEFLERDFLRFRLRVEVSNDVFK